MPDLTLVLPNGEVEAENLLREVFARAAFAETVSGSFGLGVRSFGLTLLRCAFGEILSFLVLVIV